MPNECGTPLEIINPDAAALVEIARAFCGPNHDNDTLDERMEKAVLFATTVHGWNEDPDVTRVARWVLAGEPTEGPEFEKCVG